MIFSDLIIALRHRLQDIRKADTTYISDASHNGIKWKSSDLVLICRSAIVEMLRTLSAYKLDNYINTSIMFTKKTCRIYTDGHINNLPAGLVHIYSIEVGDATNKKIYSYVSPENYISKKYYDNKSNHFTYFRDWSADNNAPKIKVCTTPAIATEQDCEVVCKTSIADILVLEVNPTLPLVDVDDLILDFCEREARDREFALERSKVLTLMINQKIKELQGGLPNSD